MPPKQDSIIEVADAIGKLIEFWGFKKNMGRLWSVLYLAPEGRLSAADLCEKLSMSSGAVSMSTKELIDWGVIKKVWTPGERRDFYEPETDIWTMVSRVFRQRELRQINNALKAFATAKNDFTDSENQEPSDNKEFVLKRLDSLEQLAKVGHHLLEAMLSGESVDSSPLAMFQLPQNQRSSDNTP